MFNYLFLALSLSLATACSTSSPRHPSSSNTDLARAETLMKKLVKDSETKKVMHCFDNLEIGPANTIDFYRTSNLNFHCIAVFKDTRANTTAYRKAYGCWPSDTSNKPMNPFQVARQSKSKEDQVMDLTIEGNYGPHEVVMIASEMSLEYHAASERFLGSLHGVPELPFGSAGSCTEVK